MAELIKLKIESVAFGGAGVAKNKGIVYFVPGTIPGETVNVRILKEKKETVFCRLVEVLKASPDRIEPVCPFAVRPEGFDPVRKPVTCPGCSYQHMTYDREIAIKQEQLEAAFSRIAGADKVKFLKANASPQRLNYRNKIKLRFYQDGNIRLLGYLMEDNYNVLDIEGCPLATEAINAKLGELRSNKGFYHTMRDKMELTLKESSSGVQVWRNKAPNQILSENLPFKGFKVPAGSFFQVNLPLAGLIVKRLEKELKKYAPDMICDLYCGTGFFTIPAAKLIEGNVYGIEIDPEAVKCATENARAAGLANCIFKCGDAADPLSPSGTSTENSMLIVDPPRTGFDKDVIRRIIARRFKRIVYISCAPDTLCRDIKELQEAGYKIISSTLFDMFPATSHFESMTILERN